MNPYLNIDTIIDQTFIQLAAQPLFRQPLVRNSAGLPIKITRFKDDDGFDDNQDGLTLSIFPYNYSGTSNETVQTGNASLVYEHYTVGSGNTPSFDRCRVHLVVKLQALSQERTRTTENYDGFEILYLRNEVERSLRKWMEMLRTILLTNPMNNLSGLVRNSHVNYISFRTSPWSKGTNLVIHEAVMLWQIEINSPRNWKTWPLYNPLDGVNNWTYIGAELRTGKPIYYDNHSGLMTYVNGVPLTVTPAPANIPVKWSPIHNRFERLDGTPLTTLELIDPATNKPWIATYMNLVGSIKGATFDDTKQNIFWNTITSRLELVDNSPFTALPGTDNILGTADDILISYDSAQSVLLITYPGKATRPINPNVDPVYALGTSNVNIYDVNLVKLSESFKI